MSEPSVSKSCIKSLTGMNRITQAGPHVVHVQMSKRASVERAACALAVKGSTAAGRRDIVVYRGPVACGGTGFVCLMRDVAGTLLDSAATLPYNARVTKK